MIKKIIKVLVHQMTTSTFEALSAHFTMTMATYSCVIGLRKHAVDSRIIIARVFGGYARRTCRIGIHFSPLGETSEYSIPVKILI